MHLNPYGDYAVILAGALADDPPRSGAQVHERMRAGGMTMDWPHRDDDLVSTLAFLDEWLAVVDAQDPAERAALLNAMMADSAAYPRLTDHDGEGWHLHYRDSDQRVAQVLRAVVSVGTSLFLVTRGMHRLHRCEASPCTRVVVDTTRNGRQRFCSVRCANRAAVRRHRAKLRAEDA